CWLAHCATRSSLGGLQTLPFIIRRAASMTRVRTPWRLLRWKKRKLRHGAHHHASYEGKKNPAAMATIDEDLGQLERDIRQLKIEYDQFFGGGRKRPPTEIEWRIDLLVKRYAERGGELKFAQRFRFNNLSQTYAKYKDIFRKKTAAKEEG